MKNIFKLLVIGALWMSTNATAAMIEGSLTVTGNYDATGGLGLGDATDVSLNTVKATNASGDFLLDITPLLPAVGGAPFSLVALPAPVDLFDLNGWQISIYFVDVVDQTGSVLNLLGTGYLTKAGFDETDVEWSFSSQSTTSYSMTVTAMPAVPVPAAVWLFGSGLIGLVAVSRRKV